MPGARLFVMPQHRRRILIVDDNEDTREMYAYYLKSVGWHVEVAPEGETGIALAQQPDGFDVIVMDLSMPKVDGWEAIRRLKADERTKSIPILLLTGHPINGAADVALAQGAAGYCRKPCPPEQLEQEIEHLLAAERNA